MVVVVRWFKALVLFLTSGSLSKLGSRRKR